MFSQVTVMTLNTGAGVAGHHSKWTCFSVKVKQKFHKRKKSLFREDEKHFQDIVNNTACCCTQMASRLKNT